MVSMEYSTYYAVWSLAQFMMVMGLAIVSARANIYFSEDSSNKEAMYQYYCGNIFSIKSIDVTK